jgi:hypothetical protein
MQLHTVELNSITVFFSGIKAKKIKWCNALAKIVKLARSKIISFFMKNRPQFFFASILKRF